MTSRRDFLLGSAALVALPSRAPAAEPALVEFGVHSETIFNLPLWIASEMGFLRQAGVDMRFITGVTVKQVEAWARDGSRPLAILPPELVFQSRWTADDLRIIGGNANRPPHFLIAQKRFKRAADLKGATFGVISDTGGTTFLVRQIMMKAGIAPDQFNTLVTGSAPARVKLLKEGAIDAALQPFPLSYEAEADGFSNLGWVGDVEPDWQFSALVANRSWLERSPGVASAILLGSLHAMRFIATNRAEAVEIAARRMHTTTALAGRALDEAIRRDMMNADLGWSPRGLLRIYQCLQADGHIPANRAFRLSDYTDAGPLARARRAMSG
jgi:ABC-type nitrate/sulfonate/bicarbonate transport system substrate-binding protein